MVSSLDSTLRNALDALAYKGLRRTLQPQFTSGKKGAVSFASNDYFGLAAHPDVVAAGIEALQTEGAGAKASRAVLGHTPHHRALELQLARLKGTEDACLFGSGYLANIGVIPALVGRHDLILTDKLVHACIIDGAALSGATLKRFAHNDMKDLQRKLAKHRAQFTRCLIITETVFSMDGDKGDVEAIMRLAKEYDAWAMSDDAHGLGLVEKQTGIEIQMGTLSKGAGTYGGYVCGSATLVDYLRNTARSFLFSTALPPSVCASASAALEVIANDKALCQRPIELAQRFRAAMGLPAAQSAIVPLIIGGNEPALALSAALREKGFIVPAIRPPTVPENTARLRIAFTAGHTEDEVDGLAGVLKKIMSSSEEQRDSAAIRK